MGIYSDQANTDLFLRPVLCAKEGYVLVGIEDAGACDQVSGVIGVYLDKTAAIALAHEILALCGEAE